MPVSLSDEEFNSQFGGGFKATPAPVGMAGRFGAAMDRTEGSLYGVGEAFGLPLGDQRRANQAEADASMQRYYKETGAPRNFDEVQFGRNFGQYVGGLAVDSAPVMAGIAAGGLVGGPAGAMAVGTAFGTGDVLDNQREQGGSTNLGTALPLGMAYGAADSMLGVGGMLARRSLGTGIRSLDRAGVDLLDGMSGVRGAAARMGATALKTGAVESGSETFQEGMNQLGRMSVDPTESFYNERSAENFKESAIGGGLLGGLIGGTAGGWTRSKEFRDNEQRDLLTGQQAEAERQGGMVPQGYQFQGPAQEPVGPQLPEQPGPFMPQGYVTQEQQQRELMQANVEERKQQLQADVDKRKQQIADATKEINGVLGMTSEKWTPQHGLYQQLNQLYQTGAISHGEFVTQTAAIHGDKPLDISGAKKFVTERTKSQKETQAPAAPSGQATQAPAAPAAPTAPLSPEDAEAQEAVAAKLAFANQELGVTANKMNRTHLLLTELADLRDLGPEAGGITPAQYTDHKAMLAGPVPTDPTTVSKFLRDVAKGQKDAAAEKTRAAKPYVPTAEEMAQAADTPTPTAEAVVAKETVASVRKAAKEAKAARKAETAAKKAAATPAVEVSDDTVGGVTVQKVAYVEPPKAKVSDDGSVSPLDAAKHIESLLRMDRDAEGETAAANYEGFKRRLRQVTGFYLDTDEDTGVEVLRQDGNPIPMAEVAEKLGVTRAAISKQFNEFGVSDKIISAVASADSGQLEEAETDTVDGDEGRETGSDTTEYDDMVNEAVAVDGRVSSTAAKAFGAGLVSGEGFTPEAKVKIDKTVAQIVALGGASDVITHALAPYQQIIDRVVARTKGVATAEDTAGLTDTELAVADSETKASKADGAARTASRIKSAILAGVANQMAAAKEQRTERNAPKTEKDLAMEAERAKRAEATVVREVAVWYNTSDNGRHAASWWDDRAVPAGQPLFDTLAPDAQFAWVRALSEVTENNINDRTYDLIYSKLSPSQASNGAGNLRQDAGAVDEGGRSAPDEVSEGRGVVTAAKPAVVVKKRRVAVLPGTAKVAQLEDDSRTIDGTNLVREISDAEMELIEMGVGSLDGPDIARLERAYNAENGTADFAAHLRNDIANYVNKGIESVSAAIRSIIKAVSEGVLAVALVFNPNVNTEAFQFDIQTMHSETVTERVAAQVPAAAKAKMSATAQQVYENMAPTAAKSGKGFIIADKVSGMLHVFNADGTLMAQDAALYGKDQGDTITGKSSLLGGAKVTPAGTFTLRASEDEEYAGGKILQLVESKAKDANVYIAVHAAWFGDAKEGRAARLKSDKAGARRISYGCINSTHEMFLGKILPNLESLNGGMIFVMPDAAANTASMFPAQTYAKTTTTTRTEDNAAQVAARSGAFGKDSDLQVFANSGRSVPVAVSARPSEAAIEDGAQRIIGSFAHQPRIVIRDSAVGSIPGATVPGATSGAVHKGAIYLFRDSIASQAELARTIFHELFHYGLRRLLTKDQFTAKMLELYHRDSYLKSEADTWAKSEDGVKAEAFGGADYALARGVDEALAVLAEPNGGAYLKNGVFDRVQRTIQRWLAAFAQALGAHKLASDIRALKNQEAREYIQSVLASVRDDTSTEKSGWGEEADTAFSKAAKSMPKAMSDTAQRLAGRTGNLLVSEAVHAAKKLGYSMLSLHDLVAEFKTKLPAVQEWYNGVQASVATRNKLEALAETIAAEAEKLPGVGKQRVSEFLALSTTTQKWGYDPKIAGKTTAVDPATEAEFKKLNQQERKIVQDVFQHGENMRVAQADLLKKLGASELFKGITPLDGPYAPLKRFGNYVALLKSQKMLDLMDTGTAAQIDALKQDPKHYRVSYFDTHGQALAFARENDAANGGTFASTANFEKSTRVDEQTTLKPEVLQKVLATIGADKNGIPAGAKAAVTKMINDMYLQSIDEHSARANGVHRFGRAGFDEDMIRSFLTHARSQAGFIANMEHGGTINGAFKNMERQARGEGNNAKYLGQDAFNMFAAHYAENLKTNETPWQDRAMALTSAWQLATSVGYHVTNATQGMMVTVPKLAADFNDYGGAWKHLMAGYKQLAAGGMWGNFDIAKVKDAGLRDALQRASDAGVLDVGMDENLTQFDAMRTGIAGVDTSSKLVRAALHKLRKVSRTVELANRVAAATAGYNMALEKGKTIAQAQDYAVSVLQSTQGDFSKTSAPLLLKRLPKVMTQYRKYQFMMGALYAKAFRQAVWGSPEEKAIGRRMLGYKLFHASMAAGALGLPMMNLAALAFSALGDDDEPKDLERSLRDAIGNDTMANMLLHGPLASLGLDMSSKLGEDKIFSIAPYGKFDLTSRKGMYETVAGVMGPSTALAGQFADATGKFMNGEYYKGLEGFMPKGVASAMKSARIANEGFTLTNGDVMFKPEDINGFALILDGLGLPSSELKRMSWIRGQQYEIGQFYKDRSSEIQKDYASAVKDGSSEELTDLRQQWMDLQDGKRGMRKYFGDSQDALKHQAITTLLQYPANAAKRERKLQDTVPQ